MLHRPMPSAVGNMPPRTPLSLRHSPPLTLSRIMVMTAALAIVFAFLPFALSVTMAVTAVCQARHAIKPDTR